MQAETGYQFPERSFYVDPGRVSEFVTALGIAPEPGYGADVGAPVPPGFLMYVTTYGAESIHSTIQADIRYTVFGGIQLDLLAPVRVGDRLTVRPHVSDVFTKTGSRGQLTFVHITADYLAADGSVVARERSVVVERPAAVRQGA
jgi:hypothetical protein